MSIRSYRELRVWQRGMDLIVLAYRVCAQLPPAENFGLKGQIRRSAVSTPSNIAEGHASGSTANYLRHIRLAQGSLSELETQLDVVGRLGYLEAGQLIAPLGCAEEVGRMLTRLATALKGRLPVSGWKEACAGEIPVPSPKPLAPIASV